MKIQLSEEENLQLKKDVNSLSIEFDIMTTQQASLQKEVTGQPFCIMQNSWASSADEVSDQADEVSADETEAL